MKKSELKQLMDSIIYGIAIGLIFVAMCLVKDDEQIKSPSRIGRAAPTYELPAVDNVPVPPVKGNVLDWRWKIKGKWYDITEIPKVLPAISKTELKHYKCEVLCKNSTGHIVGYNPVAFTM